MRSFARVSAFAALILSAWISAPATADTATTQFDTDHQFVVANIVVNPKFLKEHPDVVKNFLRAHVDLTEWINKNSAQAKQVLNQQLQKETGKPLATQVLDDAFSRMLVTYDPIRSSLLKSTQQAFDEGFLGRNKPDLSGLYDLTLLNEVLREKKARPVQ